MSARERRGDVERAAAVAKERKLRQIRPGWWVFTHGERDPLGGWGRVTATAQYLDPTTGRPVVRLTVRNLDGGRDHEVVQVPSYPAWCCAAAEARRAGLR